MKAQNFLQEMLSLELTEYKAEMLPDKLVGEIYIPYQLGLISPVPINDKSAEKDSETMPENTDSQKQGEWKEFYSVDDQIVVRLSGNVKTESRSVFSGLKQEKETYKTYGKKMAEIPHYQ